MPRSTSDPGVRTDSNPEGDDGCEADGREEVDRELVVASGDPAEVLEPTEGSLEMNGESFRLRQSRKAKA